MKTFLIFFLGIQLAWAQECERSLADAVLAMKQLKGDSFSMTYSMNVEMNSDQDNQPIQAMKHQVTITGNKSKLSNAEMDILSDGQTQITISKQEKKIYITTSAASDAQRVKKEMINLIQDSLSQWLSTFSCREVMHPFEKGKRAKRIEKRFKNKEQENQTGMSNVMYWVDEQQKQLCQIRVEYKHHSYQVRAIEFQLYEFLHGQLPVVFRGSALRAALNEKNQPLPKYKDYQVIDLRNPNP